MTGGTLAWGIAFAALCILLGVLIGWPLGYRSGERHAAEDAEDAVTAAIVTGWKELPDEDPRPAPPWPPAPPQDPHAWPGKHRHPAGPPRHTGLPAAGYLPAPEPGPWAGMMTLSAPAQSPPWDIRPASMLQPVAWSSDDGLEPVLEPTAVLSPTTDTGWTREMAKMIRDHEERIAEIIGATDGVLKEITGGAR